MAAGDCLPETISLRARPAAAAKSADTFTALINESATHPASGLTSRRNFERVVSAAMAQQDRQLLAVLDVDQFRLFKTLNGTQAADSLLRTLSRRLDAAAGAAGGCLARLGADEFAIVVPASSLPADLAGWTRTLLAEASAPFSLRGMPMAFSATLGFALLPDHGETAEAALHCARLAIAQGKHAGGGLAMQCSAVLLREARGRDELARDLRGGIAAGQIVPFYQPVIALDTGKISGLEVLARWIHPVHGMIEPANFIPLAEEQGLCRDMTRNLLAQVQRDARAWPRDWRFAFNTTPRDVVDILAYIEGPQGFCHDMIDPRRIELEVTETAIMRDLMESRDLLDAFRPHGVKLVLDDFGTGYANFQHSAKSPSRG